MWRCGRRGSGRRLEVGPVEAAQCIQTAIWRSQFACNAVRVSDLSELMRGADTLPVRVRYRIWHDHRLAEAARESNGQELLGVRRLSPRPEDLSQSEIIVSIWRSGDCLRVQYAGGLEDGSFGVGVGERWWDWNTHHGRARSSDQSPPGSAWIGKGANNFLDPVGLHHALRFGPVSHGTRVGRPVLIVDAWARSTTDAGATPQPVPRMIGVHADRYRVEVDAEHGIILSVQALFADQTYQTIDVIELKLDGPVNDELFDFNVPPASQTAV